MDLLPGVDEENLENSVPGNIFVQSTLLLIERKVARQVPVS